MFGPDLEGFFSMWSQKFNCVNWLYNNPEMISQAKIINPVKEAIRASVYVSISNCLYEQHWCISKLLLLQVYYESDVGVTEFGFVINIVIVIVVSFHLAVETLHWVYCCCYYCPCMVLWSVGFCCYISILHSIMRVTLACNESLNKGHYGANDFVPFRKVIPRP